MRRDSTTCCLQLHQVFIFSFLAICTTTLIFARLFDSRITRLKVTVKHYQLETDNAAESTLELDAAPTHQTVVVTKFRTADYL
jgi:hypothetical protein